MQNAQVLNDQKLLLIKWITETNDAQKLAKVISMVGAEANTLPSTRGKFGFAKGLIEMKEGFDDPLDGFKDYMP